jgi:hypothetical protein
MNRPFVFALLFALALLAVPVLATEDSTAGTATATAAPAPFAIAPIFTGGSASGGAGSGDFNACVHKCAGPEPKTGNPCYQPYADCQVACKASVANTEDREVFEQTLSECNAKCETTKNGCLVTNPLPSQDAIHAYEQSRQKCYSACAPNKVTPVPSVKTTPSAQCDAKAKAELESCVKANCGDSSRDGYGACKEKCYANARAVQESCKPTAAQTSKPFPDNPGDGYACMCGVKVWHLEAGWNMISEVDKQHLSACGGFRGPFGYDAKARKYVSGFVNGAAWVKLSAACDVKVQACRATGRSDDNEPPKPPGDDDNGGIEVKSCVKAGCGLQKCMTREEAKQYESTACTLEWLPEYACPREFDCKATSDGKCDYYPREKFDACVANARSGTTTATAETAVTAGG